MLGEFCPPCSFIVKVGAISGQSSNFNFVPRGEIIVVIVKQVSKILGDRSFPKERAVLAACRALRVQAAGLCREQRKGFLLGVSHREGVLKKPQTFRSLSGNDGVVLEFTMKL